MKSTEKDPLVIYVLISNNLLVCSKYQTANSYQIQYSDTDTECFKINEIKMEAAKKSTIHLTKRALISRYFKKT